MEEDTPAELITVLTEAGERIRRTVRGSGEAGPPLGVEDLYTLGGVMDELTRTLAGVMTRCATEVGAYPNTRILRDDSGTHDPAARCAEAADHLHELSQHLHAANEAARRYHSATGHIGIEVQG